MNTAATEPALPADIAIIHAISQIAGLTSSHIRRMPAIRLLKFELWLPEGVRDEENSLFLAFAESLRQFLDFDQLLPFCLWLRDQVGNHRRYLCAWFLRDFSSTLVDGYFKVAACIWQKTLGFRKGQGEIRWFQEGHLGWLAGNGAKIKEGWSDEQFVTGIYKQWLDEMHRQACDTGDLRQALLTFGAVHRY